MIVSANLPIRQKEKPLWLCITMYMSYFSPGNFPLNIKKLPIYGGNAQMNGKMAIALNSLPEAGLLEA
ncbi:MAG: hypothetical protein IJ657_00140 [Acidaminococcaceae bacterium]|nr:hypothetical protein [Acidaminococcaceae bacterium]